MMSRQTSSPMKSASVNGPMGCAMPNLKTSSTASGVATPSITAYMASFSSGIRTRFDTNPGASFTSTGVFSSFSARAFAVANVSFEVARPRITSTSFITGTGLKKCIPMTLSGRPCQLGYRNGGGVGGEQYLGTAHRVEIAEQLGLDLEALAGRFHHKIALGQPLAIRCARNARQCLLALLRGQLVLGHLALQVPADGFESPVNEALVHVNQHDVVSTFGENVSDTIAHRARADYSYCPDVHDCLKRGDSCVHTHRKNI